MKTVMVDMDNVLVNTRLLSLINEFLGTNYKRDDFKIYHLQKLVEDRKEEFWDWVKEKNLYHEVQLFEGAFEVLEKLNKYYDIYIVTAYLWNETIDISGNNLKNKYYYLKEKLPFIKPEKYIFTTNKKHMNFDIRIDDKLENLEGASIKLLFSAWHNRDLDKDYLEQENIIRVNNWYDIEKFLLKEK